MSGKAIWDYRGQNVIITGGTRGIGLKLTEAFLAAGAKVAICGRKTPETLPRHGDNEAVFHSCDVRDAAACQRFVAAVVEDFGGVDLLINNAGGSPHADAATASARFSEAIIALNLLAPLHMSQAVHAPMQAGGGGVILNIASISSVRPSPRTAAYGAAKAGLLGLTRSLAQEWGPNLRVNAIIVGMIGTEMADVTYGSAAARDDIARSIPAGRLGTGSDIADAALYLASDAAAFISGAALEVHGGGDRPLYLDILDRHAAEGTGHP